MIKLPAGVNIHNLIENIKDFSWEASETLLYYSQLLKDPNYKNNLLNTTNIDDPVTEADLKVNKMIIERINQRVDMMFKEGAISEVIKFNKLKVKKQNSSNKIIGIQEIGRYLNGELSLNEAKEQICIKTRQYAKRQTTWARGQMQSWYKIDPNHLNLVLKKFK